MGYPADGIEGRYRNHKDQVSEFLRQKHYKGVDIKTKTGHKIKIYNLCIEKDK